jgi:hypothetical protein
MRRDRLIAISGLMAATLWLGACGTGPVTFEKPGVTAAQFQRDQKECGLASADDPDRGQILSLYRVDRDVYAKCMASRGYTVMRGSRVASR